MKKEFMQYAIKEAKKAYNCDEVPVGTVIVKNNKIIAKAYNKKEKQKSVTKHAEIIAIEKASKKIDNWRLDDCDIYITLEPCPMCASAIKQARINNVYVGLKSSSQNDSKIVKKIFESNWNNKKINLIYNENIEIEKMMKNFFQKKRI